MCPAGLALHHPAAELLTSYATLGCPTETGKPWTVEQMQAAITRGPHISALVPEAVAQLQEEVREKVANGQARVVLWDEIKGNPPPQLKISPVAMIPHKSRQFRAILDLSFPVKLEDGSLVPSVNDSTTKTAPRGAIDQIGHSLQRIIHAFATADENDKIFMAKWDIKDGFWRLNCKTGEEWNFAYALPSEIGAPVQLVIPTSLQMGWIESPPYFCTAAETARDVAEQYLQVPIGDLPAHKFLSWTECDETTFTDNDTGSLRFLLEVFMDDYIALTIPTSRSQLQHSSNAVMYGIHDVFPPDEVDEEDPISLHKLIKRDGAWAHKKDLLGLTFDGLNKTVWLADDKRNAILTILAGWIRHASRRNIGVPFSEFRSVIAKLRHAFITIPAGRGLLSPFNAVLKAAPRLIYLHKNKAVLVALQECRAFLRESGIKPTKCKSLVTDWPDYIGVKDASAHGVGGIIIGEAKAVPPTVFRMQWPSDITAQVVSHSNPTGTLTNSDLEMGGLLLLWLIMEAVCPSLDGAHVALFSDNSPTVHWVQRMASKQSVVAMQLICALALRLHINNTSPLTPLHIAGVQNAMTDIPSRSWGSENKWHCKTDHGLTHFVRQPVPFTKSGLLERIPAIGRDMYARDFRSADDGFYNGRVEETTSKRNVAWQNWTAYVQPLGLDPFLQNTAYDHKVRAITGFAGRVRSGFYGRGRQITAPAVNSYLTAVGTTIALATGCNPTKMNGAQDKLIPRVAQMMAGWKKEDPPTTKKLPVGIDIPEYISQCSLRPTATEQEKSAADLILIAFYYLLRIGEYTVKGTRNSTKQTVQF